jgi:hypothetical protein
MSGSRSDRPAGPDFHPEFGFLCPFADNSRSTALQSSFDAQLGRLR